MSRHPDPQATADLARVVALAGLGESSLERFGSELASLAAELESAFDEPPEAPGAGETDVQGPLTVGLDSLREDRPRSHTRADLWLAAAPARHGDWLDVPPVRGAGDEDPFLENPSSEAASPRRTRPVPGPAAPLALLAEDGCALIRAVRTGELQASEVLEAHLAPLAAFREAPTYEQGHPIDAWFALVDARPDQARRLLETLAHDDPEVTRPLLGLPLVVKTNIATEGFETNAASRALAGWRAPYTATCVRRLMTAGALPFASANMDEFAMGSSGERSAFGATRNPWGTGEALVPGGSSSGSAAAVAAGLTPLALGSDAGGSVRQPAALCGVSGLRPSAGRLSRFGLVAFSSSFDTIGPIARSARDLLAAFEVMAGYDPRDETTTRQVPAPLLESGWVGAKLGVPRRLIQECGLEPEVAASFEASLEELVGLGAELVEIELGGPSGRPDAALSAYHVISCAEAASNLARFDGVRFGPPAPRDPDTSFKHARRLQRTAGFGTEVQRRLLIGTFSLARAGAPKLFHAARQARTRTTAEFDAAFRVCDLVVMPTSPTRAFPHGSRIHDPMAMYRADLLTVPASLAGVAAVSLPGPIPDGGLPVGLQLVAPRGADERLLDLAIRYQAVHPHHLVRPGGAS